MLKGPKPPAPPVSAKVPASAGKTPAGASATAAVTLNEAYLRNATEGQLVSRLLDVFSGLEASSAKERAQVTASANAASSPKSGPPAAGGDFTVMKAHKGIVSELCKKEYLTSPTPDVQVAVACALSCAIGGGALASRGAPNPIPKDIMSDTQCLEVLKLIVNTVQRLQSDTDKASYHSYIRNLMEKLATRHGVHSLLKRLLASTASSNRIAESTDESSELLVKVLLTISVDDDALIAQMATVVCDVIEANQSLSDSQLQLLLNSLASSATNAHRRVALAVLRRKEDVVADAVGGYLVHEVEAAVEEMMAADVAAIDDNSEEVVAARKAAVKRVGAVLESSMAVCRVGVSLASTIVPRMQQYLTVDHNDVRLIFTRTFARIFHAVPSLVQAFTPAFHAFLGRFSDTRVPIRAEMVRYAREALAGAPLSDELWSMLGPVIENKLVDSDESIRRAAVAAVVDIALVVPRRVPNKIYSLLAARCKDKTAKVRAFAVERLAELFLKTRLKWIPNAIMTTVYIASATGVDAGVVEFAISDMIPKPVDTKSSVAVTANRKKQTTLSAAGKQKTVYTFEFEGGDSSGKAAAAADANGIDTKKNIVDPTFLGGFIQLCACFDDAHWELMLALMNKKRQLRLTVLRLVEIRQALKAKLNVDKNKDNAVRLINFLSQKTNNDSWGAVFREADDTATKWLQQLCDTSCKDYFQQGQVMLDTKVKGRTHSEVLKFLSTHVIKRLCLPFAEADVVQLVATIDAERKSDPLERVGALRALEAIVHMSPHLALSVATPQLAKWIKEDSEAVRRGQNPALSKVMGISLNILSDIASQCTTNTTDSGESLPKEVLERKNDIIATLGKICLSSEDGSVAKRAALCLTSLFKNQTNAFQQLMIKVQEKLSLVAAQGEEAITPTTISLIKTFSAFCTQCPEAIVVSSDLVADSVTQIMLTAVRAHRDEDDVDAVVAAKKNPNGGNTILTYPCLLAEVVDACAKALTRHALSLPGHSAAAAGPELFNTLLKAFRETQALPTGSVGACKRRLAIHKQLIRLVFKGGHILVSALSNSTTTTRRSSDGAMTVVASQVSAGCLELMRREISVGSMISSEDNDHVRHAIQSKLKEYILKSIPLGTCDTRRVAMLCATAVAEDGKAGYNALKATLAEIGERLALARTQQNVSLSDSTKAYRYYLEYAVPSLVTYLAHHPTYEAEKKDEASPFKHFQRPWQLLFDEMLKDSTEPASALQEIFRKLRVLDDAIPNPPEDIATRVICDLGCKVLLTILGEKSVVAGGQFPGTLLMPWHFVKPMVEGQYPDDMVFLPEAVQVTARPLFGLPVGFLANSVSNPNAMGMMMIGGAGKVSQSVPRGHSRSVARTAAAATRQVDNRDDDEEDNALMEYAMTPSATPARGTAKRAREEDATIHENTKHATASPKPLSAAGAAAAGVKKAARTETKAVKTSPPLTKKKEGGSTSRGGPSDSHASDDTNVRGTSTGGDDNNNNDDHDDATSITTDTTNTTGMLDRIRDRIDASQLGDDCPSEDIQMSIVKAVADTIAKYPPSEVHSIKFGEIKVAVQAAIGRKWNDGEKEYAKLCAVAQQSLGESQSQR